MCREYNGWSNYQTWNVSMWLDNDQVTYYHIREMAKDYLDDDTWKFAAYLRDYVEENNPLADSNASLFTDLMGHALANVEYGVIAEGILDEIREDLDE